MDISFTQRLSAVIAISTALRDSQPSYSSEEIHVEAKKLEAEIHNKASSQEEYEARCSERVTSLKDHGIEEVESLDDGLNPDGPDMGPFKQVTFFKDGLLSTVFKARPPESQVERESTVALVALKVTTPASMDPPHNSEREARILEGIKSEYIIPLLQTLWQPGGRFILAFPFMPLDLASLMHNSRLQSWQCEKVSRDLFQALAHIHSLGIIHRDIKPSNILLRSPDGPAYLADFGIAWSPVDEASETASNKIIDVGTTCYRPPELLFGDVSYGTSLDLWAAGCTVAEMLRPNHETLFESGDLGSELALIKSIFSTLGTPDEHVWPSVKSLPYWGQMQFVQYPSMLWEDLLLGAPKPAIEFVSRLMVYEPSHRMTAMEALSHPWLKP